MCVYLDCHDSACLTVSHLVYTAIGPPPQLLLFNQVICTALKCLWRERGEGEGEREGEGGGGGGEGERRRGERGGGEGERGGGRERAVFHQLCPFSTPYFLSHFNYCFRVNSSRASGRKKGGREGRREGWREGGREEGREGES